jgi:D-tyrosyl-tRNA(Tyr) deacylase
MKLVVQRVTHARVVVDDQKIAAIKDGLLVLVGIGKDDTVEQIDPLLTKLFNLRIFSDQEGKMNLSVRDIDGEVLLVSQFTLYGDCKKGNRPSFINAMPPAQASLFFDAVVAKAREFFPRIQSGVFGGDMKVELLNDGPITILLEN